MVPMMVDFLLDTKTNESREDLEKLVVDFVDRLTGKQTIYQMIRLAEEMKKRGGQPLDPKEYKEIYHQKLNPLVKERIAKLESGELSGEQLTVNGSINFLEDLYNQGISLYLASGTDIEYVRHEAEVLGVDSYFQQGGIFGAVKNYKNFSKEMVIKKILQDYDLRGSELMIVGDGYVEIQNAKDVNAIALGVASAKHNNYNMNAHKRQRLIDAGADLMITDFSEHNKLMKHLFEV
ncbi:MAG: HAD hydrolase-like protein [Candidatus Cloacimonetes bacterium]|nr:HAD hydrolase-like protein [Candidatus Cloacimonadota bacterium]